MINCSRFGRQQPSGRWLALTPADLPLIDAEKLSKQPGPPQEERQADVVASPGPSLRPLRRVAATQYMFLPKEFVPWAHQKPAPSGLVDQFVDRLVKI
jgi:hypothetical protein